MELGTRAGIPVANRWDASSVPGTLTQIGDVLPPLCNEQIKVATADQLGLQWAPIHSATVRTLAPAVFTNGRPECFGDRSSITAFSPDFKVLSIQNGYVGHFFGAALVLSPDGRSIVTGCQLSLWGFVPNITILTQ